MSGEANRIQDLITSRNPDCRVYGTDGPHEFMALEEGISLLLKTAGKDSSDPASRSLAKPIAKVLGCLALALVQAGAAILRNRCQLEDYLDVYARNHKEVMSTHPGQGTDGYEYTVYTTWEISRRMIESLGSEESSDAVDFLDISGFSPFRRCPRGDIQRDSYQGRPGSHSPSSCSALFLFPYKQ